MGLATFAYNERGVMLTNQHTHILYHLKKILVKGVVKMMCTAHTRKTKSIIRGCAVMLTNYHIILSRVELASRRSIHLPKADSFSRTTHLI